MDWSALIPSGLMVVLWYLLRQKDARQGEEIGKLFALHDADVEKLALLKLELAKNHYEKAELDPKFIRLEAAITDGLNKMNHDLGMKIDKLSDVMQAHLIADGKKWQ